MPNDLARKVVEIKDVPRKFLNTFKCSEKGLSKLIFCPILKYFLKYKVLYGEFCFLKFSNSLTFPTILYKSPLSNNLLLKM